MSSDLGHPIERPGKSPEAVIADLRDALAGAVNYIRWRDKGAIWCSPGFDDLDQVLADGDAAIRLADGK